MLRFAAPTFAKTLSHIDATIAGDRDARRLPRPRHQSLTENRFAAKS